jgi:hypothetical protein
LQGRASDKITTLRQTAAVFQFSCAFTLYLIMRNPRQAFQNPQQKDKHHQQQIRTRPGGVVINLLKRWDNTGNRVQGGVNSSLFVRRQVCRSCLLFWLRGAG